MAAASPPGLAANPEALPKCSNAEFEANACKPETQVGTTELDAVAAELLTLKGLKGKVFNLQPPAGSGLPLDFGINVEPAGALTAPVQLYLEGHVTWYGDYHEYFEINDVPEEAEVELPLLPPAKVKLKTLKSKLNFDGHAGIGNFLTLPSAAVPAARGKRGSRSSASESFTTSSCCACRRSRRDASA